MEKTIPDAVRDIDLIRRDLTEGLLQDEFCPDMAKDEVGNSIDCGMCDLHFYCGEGSHGTPAMLIDFLIKNEYITKAQALELTLDFK